MHIRLLAFLLLTLLWSGPVAAASAAAASSAAAGPAALPDKAQIDQAIKLLEDDQARDRLIKQLKALNKAVDAVDEEEERVTVGARMLAEIRARYAAAQKLWETASSVTASWPTIVGWIDKQAANKASYERWRNFFIALAEVLIAGYAARAIVWWMLGRPRRWLENRTPPNALAKLPYLLGRTLLNALPAAALAVAAYGVLALTDPAERVRVAALPIINASIAIQLMLLAGAFFLSPTAPGLRLLKVDDGAANRAMRHIKHMAAFGFYGWFLTESAYLLGLPKPAYELILKIVGGVVALMVVRRIFTWRRAVARLIRGDHAPAMEENAQTGEQSRLGAARRRLAEVWHLIAIGYVTVACAVWLLEIKGGFAFIAKATAVSAAALFFAQALTSAVTRVLAKPANLSPSLNTHLPSLERRLDGYRPWAARIITVLIWLGALVVAADAWGAGALERLASNAGQRLVGSALTIGLALVLSIAAWEVVSLSIERALTPEGKDGARIERSARVRTLLPLLRNAFLVLLVVFVGLFTLAELGVNIGPLLAGAGVIGLAVGFGSQTLVKDVITGLFILIEDTIAVGDVVDVGGKHVGAVEAISIRTIRLRDTSGAVHTVPFSAVTTIRNMTKDYSFAVFDVQVGYNEDPDRVAEVLKDIAHSIMEDETFRRDLLAPLEVMGLDRLADSGIVIKARFKTRPMRQWAISREFNRRMKKRFDELGISIPYPHMQLLVNPPPAGPAGPAAPQALDPA